MSVHSNDGKLTWSTKLDRIGELSVANKHLVFNNLGHLINADMLMEQYQQLDRNKAVGIDKVTKASYGINLNENIQTLILKIRRGTYKPQPSRITEIPKEDGSYTGYPKIRNDMDPHALNKARKLPELNI